MISHKIINPILLVLLLVGCSGENKFSDADFGEVKSLVRIDHQTNVPIKPKDIWVVSDTLLLVANQGVRDSMYLYVNPSSWEVTPVIVGQKPDSRLVKSSDNIMIYDPIAAIVSTMNVGGEVTRKSTVVPLYDVPQNLHYENSTYFYEGYAEGYQKIFVRVAGDDRVVLSDFKAPLKITKNQRICEGFTGVNPKTNRVVYAYKYLHRFEIYDENGKMVCVNVNPSSSTPDIQDSEWANDEIEVQYGGVVTTQENIFLYHVGHSLKDATTVNVVTHVEVFDWDGNPTKRYRLSGYNALFTFINGSFVGVSSNPEGRWSTYKIE